MLKFIGRKSNTRHEAIADINTLYERSASGSGPRLSLYVRHPDAECEWAYDREARIGRLNQGLDEAVARGWTVVSMKD